MGQGVIIKAEKVKDTDGGRRRKGTKVETGESTRCWKSAREWEDWERSCLWSQIWLRFLVLHLACVTMSSHLTFMQFLLYPVGMLLEAVPGVIGRRGLASSVCVESKCFAIRAEQSWGTRLSDMSRNEKGGTSRSEFSLVLPANRPYPQALRSRQHSTAWQPSPILSMSLVSLEPYEPRIGSSMYRGRHVKGLCWDFWMGFKITLPEAEPLYDGIRVRFHCVLKYLYGSLFQILWNRRVFLPKARDFPELHLHLVLLQCLFFLTHHLNEKS